MDRLCPARSISSMRPAPGPPATRNETGSPSGSVPVSSSSAARPGSIVTVLSWATGGLFPSGGTRSSSCVLAIANPWPSLYDLSIPDPLTVILYVPAPGAWNTANCVPIVLRASPDAFPTFLSFPSCTEKERSILGTRSGALDCPCGGLSHVRISFTLSPASDTLKTYCSESLDDERWPGTTCPGLRAYSIVRVTFRMPNPAFLGEKRSSCVPSTSTSHPPPAQPSGNM